MRYPLLLSIAVTLCLYIGVSGDNSIKDCGDKDYWIISRQAVYTYSTLAATRTEVNVYLDEVFYSGSRDMVRTIKLSKVMGAIRIFAWQQVFSDEKKYKVIEKSPYHVYKFDGFILTFGVKTLKGHITLGENTIENDGLKYTFYAEKGGKCNQLPSTPKPAQK